MTSAKAPAEPSPKCPTSARKKRTLTILATILFWTMAVLVCILAVRKPQQQLQITNTGSQSVDIRNVSAFWLDDKVLTLHPGMSGFWTFGNGDQFRITPSDEEPPTPGTTPGASPPPSRSKTWGSALTQNADGSGAIVIKHASRTAEVRVSEAGDVEFEFTDL